MTIKYITDLKLIAIITMLIDHIGLIFFPQYLIFRLIGRLSFPLFAYSVAQGAKYTKNWPKYALRLFIFALISQYPYYLFRSITPYSIAKTNVLFTLFVGLLFIQTFKSKFSIFYKLPIYYLLFTITYLLDSDYQIPGVLTVFFSYLFMNNFPALFVSQLFLFMSPILLYIFASLSLPVSASYWLPLFAPFAFLLTLLQQPARNPKLKYLLYLVYPAQFIIIFFLKRLVSPS